MPQAAHATHRAPVRETRRETHETPQPIVRDNAVLPVRAREPGGEAVGFARHAETNEQAEKLMDFERAKIPPPGSRNYVAGQPVNEEEYERTQEEADRLARAGLEWRREAEKQMQKFNPGDKDYHPYDPEFPDPDRTVGASK